MTPDLQDKMAQLEALTGQRVVVVDADGQPVCAHPAWRLVTTLFSRGTYIAACVQCGETEEQAVLRVPTLPKRTRP